MRHRLPFTKIILDVFPRPRWDVIFWGKQTVDKKPMLPEKKQLSARFKATRYRNILDKGIYPTIRHIAKSLAYSKSAIRNAILLSERWELMTKNTHSRGESYLFFWTVTK